MVSRPLVSMAERVRKAWFELVSRKSTGRYSGCMPTFLVARPLKRLQIIKENPRFSSPPHRVEELGVGLGGFELVDEELCGLQLVHREQQLSQHPHLLQDRLLDQQFLAPRAGPGHVDCR